MTIKRGDIWLANLDPTQGSEQAGVRPVMVFQNDKINKFTRTVLTVPLTTNLRRAKLPSCHQIPAGEGGLDKDSVLLGHQLRVLDKSRLYRKLGSVSDQTLASIEAVILFTTGIVK
jgi:mRNA interferase MazF